MTSFFKAPPDMVAKNYRQALSFAVPSGSGFPQMPGNTSHVGLGDLGALGDSVSDLSTAIHNLEQTAQRSLEAYMRGWTIPMNFKNMEDDAAEVQSLLYKPGIPKTDIRDKAYGDAGRIFNLAYDAHRQGQSQKGALQIVPYIVADVESLAGNAAQLVGYQRAESLKPTLYKFYIDQMSKAKWGMEKLIPELQKISTNAQWTAWYQAWMKDVDAYLLPIPPTWPGYQQVFARYAAVMKELGTKAKDIAKGGFFARMWDNVVTGMLGVVDALDGAIHGMWDYMKKTMPNLTGALTWLPWVGLGILGLVGYQYLMAPGKRVGLT